MDFFGGGEDDESQRTSEQRVGREQFRPLCFCLGAHARCRQPLAGHQTYSSLVSSGFASLLDLNEKLIN